MKRVFLAGTTTGTTWRQTVTEQLLTRGVAPEQIFNPHLPKGVSYTPEHMELERTVKRDSETIVLIYVCPAVMDEENLSPEVIRDKTERLGPISMFEIGKFAYAQPHRTAVVLDSEQFTPSKRPRKVLEGLAQELREDFHGQQPYFASLPEAISWIADQLT